MRSSVSIVLFFLLSGLFLSLLLGSIERSRKLLATAGACLAAVVAIIVVLTPVQLPWSDDKPAGQARVTTTTVAPEGGVIDITGPTTTTVTEAPTTTTPQVPMTSVTGVPSTTVPGYTVPTEPAMVFGPLSTTSTPHTTVPSYGPVDGTF